MLVVQELHPFERDLKATLLHFNESNVLQEFLGNTVSSSFHVVVHPIAYANTATREQGEDGRVRAPSTHHNPIHTNEDTVA